MNRWAVLKDELKIKAHPKSYNKNKGRDQVTVDSTDKEKKEAQAAAEPLRFRAGLSS